MRRFKGVVRTNVHGSDIDFEFEVEDDATEQEIADAAHEEAIQWIDIGWDEIHPAT